MSQIIDQQVSTANPFPGLRPFKIEESHLFFGREGQSDEVLLKLSKNRFIGVIGPSGSGKSSFIYCGVMPILYGGFLTDASVRAGDNADFAGHIRSGSHSQPVCSSSFRVPTLVGRLFDQVSTSRLKSVL